MAAYKAPVYVTATYALEAGDERSVNLIIASVGMHNPQNYSPRSGVKASVEVTQNLKGKVFYDKLLALVDTPFIFMHQTTQNFLIV